MDPLITNGIESIMLGGLEKRGEQSLPPPRRKRGRAPQSAEPVDEVDSEVDLPPHQLDDLA